MPVGEEEKRNKKIGMMVSAGLHVILLLAFLFILAWKAPDPPLPEYGIELNFGLMDAGGGDIQPEQQPVTSDNTEEEAQPEEVPEESIEQPVEETETEEEVEAVEEPAEDVVETTTTTEVSDEVLPEEKKEAEKPAEVTPQKEEVKPVEEKSEAPQPEKVKDPEQPSTGAKGDEGESEKPLDASHGDDPDKEGDKGDEEGKLDARALYGKSGGGAGPALSIIGWIWDEVPNQKDNSSENGTIVFKFIIDQDGYVINVQTVESSVSPGVTKFYEEQLRKTTFSKTGSGAITSSTTTGTVTFVIKSK